VLPNLIYNNKSRLQSPHNKFQFCRRFVHMDNMHPFLKPAVYVKIVHIIAEILWYN